MSNPGEADTTPITSVRQLADYIAGGSKRPEDFRIGTEHEMFGFRRPGLEPPGYSPRGIEALLENLGRLDGEPIRDRGNIIGLKQGGGASVSLEPAGQVELSGAPLATLHDTKAEFDAHFARLRQAAAPLDLGFAPLGFHPTQRRDAMPWMPKGRYAIMRRFMPIVGTMGLDMMTRTCTVQVNLDFASEADMVRKLRVGLALQPLATALFANSPFTEGRANGFLSYRAHVWTDTDNVRSGIPRVMFEAGFGFERYAEWLVDAIPMYFIYRDGSYIDVAGRSFRDFLAGEVRELVPHTPTLGDFIDHMTTAFTDVRVKRFLEMRGADAGRPEMMLAQSALWVGLLYDEAALEAAHAMVRDWSWEEVVAMRDAVPRVGLDATTPAGPLRVVAREVLGIARGGLQARRRLDPAGQDETAFLRPLEEIVDGGPNQAEYWLDRYRNAWGNTVRPIFREGSI